MSYARIRASILALFACALTFAGETVASSSTTRTWIIDGPLTQIERVDDRVFLGGGITYVGPPTGAGAVIDPYTGGAQAPFPEVEGSIYAVAADGTGGWYLGGSFSSVRGEPRINLAHVEPDGALSAWNPSASATVRALTVSGGLVYAGGDFETIGGQPRSLLGAIDAVTGEVTAWNPDVDGLGSPRAVYALAIVGDVLYAGGRFQWIGGVPRPSIGAVSASTGQVLEWNPSGAAGAVHALAASENTLYVGGSFTEIAQRARNRLAALDRDTGEPTPWNPDANDAVLALAILGDRVHAGGMFTTIGGQLRWRLAAVDAASGSLLPWNVAVSGPVMTLVERSGTIYAGGDFRTARGPDYYDRPVRYLAAFDAASGDVLPFGGAAMGIVRALHVATDGSLFAGGSFESVGGRATSGGVTLDAVTGEAVHPVFPAPHFAVLDGVVYSGDELLHATDVETGDELSWGPCQPRGGAPVDVLSADSGNIYVGGNFELTCDKRFGFAALDAWTRLPLPWPDYFDNRGVTAITPAGPVVLISGPFTSIAGESRPYYASVSAASGAVLPWNPNANGGGGPIAVSGQTVYLAGGFSRVDGQPRNFLAAVEIGHGRVLPWNPRPDDAVECIAVANGLVFVGGRFRHIGGEARNFVAALDPVTGNATAWAPEVNHWVEAIEIGPDAVYLGGRFTRVEGRRAVGLAVLRRPFAERHEAALPEGTPRLAATAPNPFRDRATLHLRLPTAGPVRVRLFDVQGRLVETLLDRRLEEGAHQIQVDGRHLSAGIYWCSLESGGRTEAWRMTLLK